MVSKYNTERKYKEGQQNRKDIFEFIENYINLHEFDRITFAIRKQVNV